MSLQVSPANASHARLHTQRWDARLWPSALSILARTFLRPIRSLVPLTLPETLPTMKSMKLSITDVRWGRRYPGGVIDVVRQRFDQERATALNVTRLSRLDLDCVDVLRAEVLGLLKREGLDALQEQGLQLEKGSPYLPVDQYWTGCWFT